MNLKREYNKMVPKIMCVLIHTHIPSRDEQNYSTITANNTCTLEKVITNIF